MRRWAQSLFCGTANRARLPSMLVTEFSVSTHVILADKSIYSTAHVIAADIVVKLFGCKHSHDSLLGFAMGVAATVANSEQLHLKSQVAVPSSVGKR